MKPLEDKVAVVAGATRGAGRGIACMLGEAGATVYCTGRSVRGKSATANRPETIEETAEMVTERGGIGIYVQIDHTVEDQVKSLFKRVKKEQNHLDILVNDVWGGDELTEWGKPFWKLTSEKGLLMLERAIHSHIITSRYGVPIMIENNQGLVIEITDGDGMYYRGNLFYDLVKISVIRLAYGMSREFRDYNITSVALTPGFLRSEAMLDHFGVTEENWREAVKKDQYFAESETPFYIGRAVAALASDPNISEKSGKALATWNLSKEYGFTDIDGRQPDIGGYFSEQSANRWNQLVSFIQEEFRANNQDSTLDLEHDLSSLELRASLEPGSSSPQWYARSLLFPELLMHDPKTLAVDFCKRYRKALDKQ